MKSNRKYITLIKHNTLSEQVNLDICELRISDDMPIFDNKNGEFLIMIRPNNVNENNIMIMMINNFVYRGNNNFCGDSRKMVNILAQLSVENIQVYLPYDIITEIFKYTEEKRKFLILNRYLRNKFLNHFLPFNDHERFIVNNALSLDKPKLVMYSANIMEFHKMYRKDREDRFIIHSFKSFFQYIVDDSILNYSMVRILDCTDLRSDQPILWLDLFMRCSTKIFEPFGGEKIILSGELCKEITESYSIKCLMNGLEFTESRYKRLLIGIMCEDTNLLEYHRKKVKKCLDTTKKSELFIILKDEITQYLGEKGRTLAHTKKILDKYKIPPHILGKRLLEKFTKGKTREDWIRLLVKDVMSNIQDVSFITSNIYYLSQTSSGFIA